MVDEVPCKCTMGRQSKLVARGSVYAGKDKTLVVCDYKQSNAITWSPRSYVTIIIWPIPSHI